MRIPPAVLGQRGAGVSKLPPSLLKRSETAIQREVLRYLATVGIVAWRNNTGAVKEGDRFVRFGLRGAADIIGWMPGGRFIAIECKRPGEKPTAIQSAFLKRLHDDGGIAFVATSVEDVSRELARV